MQRDQVLSKYTGKNEKTVIKSKLVKKGGGAPQRPNPVDEETHKKMMAYWHKKNEEAKQMEENADENDYLNSAWANPKSFKANANGIGPIQWRGGF